MCKCLFLFPDLQRNACSFCLVLFVQSRWARQIELELRLHLHSLPAQVPTETHSKTINCRSSQTASGLTAVKSVEVEQNATHLFIGELAVYVRNRWRLATVMQFGVAHDQHHDCSHPVLIVDSMHNRLRLDRALQCMDQALCLQRRT